MAGLETDYTVSFANGITSVFKNGDLISKIESPDGIIELNSGLFSFVAGGVA